MRHQIKPYTCGPASIANALKCYRRRFSEKRLAKIANTTENGTSEIGLYAALNETGFHHETCEYTSFRDAYLWLKKQLERGCPVVLCVSGWGHYITAIGLLGSKVLVFDPALDVAVRKENGVLVYSKSRLRRLWYHPVERAYWAMAIKRPGA